MPDKRMTGNTVMDDEQVWLEEAEYQEAPVHRLRKAPVAAAIAAAATLALVMAMPRSWIERAVYELYIDTVIPAAKLPIGDMGHAVVAFVTATVVALIAFAVARFVDFGRLLSRRDETPSAIEDIDESEPRLRRADSHPDAPPRAPFRFDPDFDADDGAAAAAQAADDADDDVMFDLGGFEAVDEPDEAQDEPAIFDVAAIGSLEMPPAAQEDEAHDEHAGEPLVARDGEIDPLVDVRAKFADMFGPGEHADDVERESAASDLSLLTTGALIDELERRMAARHRATEREPSEVAEPATRPAAIAQDEPIAAPIAPPQGRTERAANDQLSDDPVAEDPSIDEGIGGDPDDMDAALQAALGTLARMQQRSVG